MASRLYENWKELVIQHESNLAASSDAQHRKPAEAPDGVVEAPEGGVEAPQGGADAGVEDLADEEQEVVGDADVPGPLAGDARDDGRVAGFHYGHLGAFSYHLRL